MRTSKLPYKSFDYNIRRAEALARLDGYLEDLLHNEGKGTIKPLFKIPNDLMQALGMEGVIDKALKRVGMEMKKEFEEEVKQKGKEYYERVAKEIILPYLRSLKHNRSLYRSGWERRRIRQLSAEYKERAIQSIAAEIDQQILKLCKKLEKTKSKKKKSALQEQIQKLREERKAYEMVNLIL